MRVWYSARGGADAAIQSLIFATAPIWLPVGAVVIAGMMLSNWIDQSRAEEKAARDARDPVKIAAKQAQAAAQARADAQARVQAQAAAASAAWDRQYAPWPALKCDVGRKQVAADIRIAGYGWNNAQTYADRALAMQRQLRDHGCTK